MENARINEITRQILDASITVHKIMGPGLLESVYEYCLKRELELRGLKVQSQVSIPLIYKGELLTKDYKIDLLIEDTVIIELKSVGVMLPVFDAQIISYLKLADKRIGLLINFNVPLLKDGFRRVVNNF